MRSFVRLFLIMTMGLLINVSAFAQKDDTKKVEKMSWDEAKEAFHEVMAGTFHPAQEDNFKPLKEKYKDLIMASKTWKKISIPETLDEKLLSEKLEKLFVDSSILGELVKGGGSDADLKKAIYALHDVFHGIVGLCDEH